MILGASRKIKDCSVSIFKVDCRMCISHIRRKCHFQQSAVGCSKRTPSKPPDGVAQCTVVASDECTVKTTMSVWNVDPANIATGFCVEPSLGVPLRTVRVVLDAALYEMAPNQPFVQENNNTFLFQIPPDLEVGTFNIAVVPI